MSWYLGNKRVKIFWNSSNIPADFTQLEYLESTGNQYIDTGIAPANITPIVKLSFMTGNSASGASGIFGCFGDNDTRFQLYFISIGIGTYITRGWNLNTTYTVELDGSVPKAIVNNISIVSGFTKDNGFSEHNMFLFTRNTNNGADPGMPQKLYYCQIYDGNKMVRNFIPCLDTAGIACMYDTVSKQAFYNQGTGNFTAGPVKQ